MKLRRRLILSSAAALTALSIAAPRPSQAYEEVSFGDAAAIPFDLFLLRPLGIIRIIVGAGMYLPSLLVTAPSAAYDRSMSDIADLTETFIREPFDYVFLRPPGTDLDGG